MAATTITEYKNRPCARCGGAGFLSTFQHRNGGECFRCGASGNDPLMVEVTRDMTDEEVVAALAAHGFPIVQTERVLTGDWLVDMFLSDDEVAAQVELMRGARIMLAAI